MAPMTTPATGTSTTGEGGVQPVRCGYCPQQVVFLPTYIGGHALCFDAAPQLRTDDHAKAGWIPGPFYVEGRRRFVWAPWTLHSSDIWMRTRVVRHLHLCPGQTRAAGGAW